MSAGPSRRRLTIIGIWWLLFSDTGFSACLNVALSEDRVNRQSSFAVYCAYVEVCGRIKNASRPAFTDRQIGLANPWPELTFDKI